MQKVTPVTVYTFGNIYLVFLPAMRTNGKASYMSDLMMVCKEFMEVIGTFEPVDTVNWSHITRYNDSMSTSIQFSIR